MSLSLILVCFWAVVANVLAMTPSKDHHWRNAYILIGIGTPLLAYVAVQHGPWAALLVFAGGCSVLRWPVIYFGRWLRQKIAPSKGPAE